MIHSQHVIGKYSIHRQSVHRGLTLGHVVFLRVEICATLVSDCPFLHNTCSIVFQLTKVKSIDSDSGVSQKIM